MAEGSATLFLSGDVMTGRGIDQALAYPCDPELREPYVLDARTYVELAEAVSGPIAKPVEPQYPWGDALAELARVRPDARVVNLETSITRSDAFWPAKSVHYRMSPENAECLAAAELDVCVLANNHLMDFGLGGLRETLATLDRLGIAHAGAGQTLEDAEAPAIVDLGARGRVLVFSIASPSSGVPRAWEASSPGVAMVTELSLESVRGIRARIERHARPGDIVVLSIHWGPNWSYEITPRERRFAHALVEDAGVHVVHGHSSHHVKAIEPYHGQLILYGCGDLLTDYEGIRGNERYRGELGLMYFATLDLGTGRCERVEMTPTRVHRLRVTRASHDEALWLAEVLRHEAGASVELDEADRLHLRV